jgi:hypothetical protein
MTAVDILKLIETVSPEDSEGLDEIDLALARYLVSIQETETQRTLTRIELIEPARMGVRENGKDAVKSRPERSRAKFTRSLDAQETIGREVVSVAKDKNKWVVLLEGRNGRFLIGRGKTEKLARLVAKIMDIGYERERG